MSTANRITEEATSARSAVADPLPTEAVSADGKSSAPPWLGKRVGHFKLIGLLGQGAMGRVFRVEDTLLRRYVALKVLPKSIKRNEKGIAIERLIHEAQACATLDHPNVVSVYEVNEAGGVYYIAMELAEGGSLRELVKAAGPLEYPRACLLCADAADALAHAHSLGIVHRDVKPANLMLTRSGRCKVTDFGLARGLDTAELSKPIPEAVGTPQFIAPELLRGESASLHSDIYSLGATLWYLLTGRSVFEATSTADLLQKHLDTPIPDLRNLRPDVPVSLAKAIQKALAKKQQDRYESAAQFAKVLRVHTIPLESSGSFASNSVPLNPEDTATFSLSRTRTSGVLTDAAPAPETPRVSKRRNNRRVIIGASAAAAALLIAAMVPAIQQMGHHTQIAGQGPSVPQLSSPAQSESQTPPPGWVPIDIGSPALSGWTSVRQNVWTIGGAGNPSAPAEQFHFVSKSFLGDGVFSAKLEKFESGFDHAQSGVTLRDGSSAAGPCIELLANSDGSLLLRWRSANEKPFESAKLESATAPQWLKLVRTDDTFSGYASNDGVNWRQIGDSKTISMPRNVRAGLLMTSGNEKKVATASFESVQINDSREPGQ